MSKCSELTAEQLERALQYAITVLESFAAREGAPLGRLSALAETTKQQSYAQLGATFQAFFTFEDLANRDTLIFAIRRKQHDLARIADAAHINATDPAHRLAGLLVVLMGASPYSWTLEQSAPYVRNMIKVQLQRAYQQRGKDLGGFAFGLLQAEANWARAAQTPQLASEAQGQMRFFQSLATSFAQEHENLDIEDHRLRGALVDFIMGRAHEVVLAYRSAHARTNDPTPISIMGALGSAAFSVWARLVAAQLEIDDPTRPIWALDRAEAN